MLTFTDSEKAAALAKLAGAASTPESLRLIARQLEAESLIRYGHKAGRWYLTDRGADFITKRA